MRKIATTMIALAMLAGCGGITHYNKVVIAYETSDEAGKIYVKRRWAECARDFGFGEPGFDSCLEPAVRLAVSLSAFDRALQLAKDGADLEDLCPAASLLADSVAEAADAGAPRELAIAAEDILKEVCK